MYVLYICWFLLNFPLIHWAECYYGIKTELAMFWKHFWIVFIRCIILYKYKIYCMVVDSYSTFESRPRRTCRGCFCFLSLFTWRFSMHKFCIYNLRNTSCSIKRIQLEIVRLSINYAPSADRTRISPLSSAMKASRNNWTDINCLLSICNSSRGCGWSLAHA